ncbi:ATP-binding cassette domain-containing protein [Enterobacter roggenkampii]|uniref:ATP-binding cassette domain-containing protein n=1 Tax=Enterobacter roggenkampii TaxID=1812935 RepID=UPI003C2DC6F0
MNAGQRIAILGRTGCGKSTLLQLLTRAWDPQRGQIRFNNTLLTDFSEQALRKTVSVDLPQPVRPRIAIRWPAFTERAIPSSAFCACLS